MIPLLLTAGSNYFFTKIYWRSTPTRQRKRQRMSALETMVGGFTVGELASKIGIPVATLIDRVSDRNVSPSAANYRELAQITSDGYRNLREGMDLTLKVNEALKPKASASKSSGNKIGNLQSTSAREKFDAAIMDVLNASPEPLKIDEIRTTLPWNDVARDQVSRAMPRLQKAGKITASGNTQARVYTPVRGKKN